jgi:predicted dehydrogenase
MHAAIVGAGGAGLLHALAFRAHGIAIRTVFDPDPARARNLADLCGAHATTHLDALADSDAACISICSPPRWHAEQALQCAREGRTIFVEKPVAVTSDELARLAAARGCVPIVQWRAGRGIRAIRNAVAEWLLGPSPSVCVDLALRRSAAYFAAGRGTRATWGCGALLSVGIHAIDAACFALDRAALRVRSVVGPHAPEETERTACAVIAFIGGATGTVRVTFDAGDDDARLVFTGGGVTAVLSGSEIDPTAGPVQWRSPSTAKRTRLEAIERAAGGHRTAPLLVPYLGDAIAALRAGATPGSDPALPAIGDVAAAHDIALRAASPETPPVRAASLAAPDRTA